ncbi:MAG: putative ABC transporter permease [Ruminococcus sp.]
MIICFFYLLGVVVATALGHVTAVLMENIFHTSWWDHSDNKFNFRGRICLELVPLLRGCLPLGFSE